MARPMRSPQSDYSKVVAKWRLTEPTSVRLHSRVRPDANIAHSTPAALSKGFFVDPLERDRIGSSRRASARRRPTRRT